MRVVVGIGWAALSKCEWNEQAYNQGCQLEGTHVVLAWPAEGLGSAQQYLLSRRSTLKNIKPGAAPA